MRSKQRIRTPPNFESATKLPAFPLAVTYVPDCPPFHAGYSRTGPRQGERLGLLRGSECMVRFTREVPIPPLVRATRTHMQRTATAELRAKTHQRQGPPYRILPPPKGPGWACRRGSG